MDGHLKTSTLDVTSRVPLFLYSRSKMVIASVDSLRLSGHIKAIKVTYMQCYSTCLANVDSLASKQEKICAVISIMDLALRDFIHLI